MHSFHFKKLPPSFNEMWITNRERNPERVLRNANDLYVPPQRVEFVKKLPNFAFPAAWNSAPGNKTNPVQHLHLRELKSILLAAAPL
jgi:hypothetical protein